MSIFFKFCLLIVLILKPFYTHSNNEEKLTIAQLIQSAELTLKKLNKNTDMENFKNYLKNSRAILIFPDIYEGGFFFWG